MKKLALVASLFVFAACGAKTEEAAPAADSTAVAPAATRGEETTKGARPAWVARPSHQTSEA